MIRTLTVGSDPREELKARLAHLQDVELPKLRSERGELGHLGTAALRDYARREVQDVARLLAELQGELELVPDGTVRLNDCVVLQEQSEGEPEEFIVHAPGLIVKAPGFISAETALGAAVLGKQAGDLVQVRTPRGSRDFVVQGVRRRSR
ncbi:MAG TPA: GreA/GreB family elongation factor [Actinomycetota bacterium]|nr:GreA/GreB family elongation factor [Actinomycetota bacterium]